MIDSGGDGGLSTAIELKAFNKLETAKPLRTRDDAKLVAVALRDNWEYQRSIALPSEPPPPKIETTITKAGNEFIVWWRECT